MTVDASGRRPGERSRPAMPEGVRALGVLAVLALVALVAAMALDDGGAATADVPGLGPQGRRPQFKVECTYSHSDTDDPIVWPGAHGASHRHDFFGATTVDADSTPADLLGGDTTCKQRLDTAAYWAPSLYDGTQPVTPVELVAYYRPAVGTDPADIHPYPHGLVAIAGDPEATEPQDPSVVAWHCGNRPDLRADPPTCSRNAPLTLRVAFPSCWDGERTDSPDHRAHLAYATAVGCPADHPVAVPELVLEIEYPVWGEGHDLTLASGSPWTAHADFMNAWDQDKLEQEVRVCLNAGRICGVVSGRGIG